MKIRLAKHTRALAAALAFCVLSAVPAYAQEDDTVEVPGVPVTLSLPAGSLILTRETPVDDAIFVERRRRSHTRKHEEKRSVSGRRSF